MWVTNLPTPFAETCLDKYNLLNSYLLQSEEDGIVEEAEWSKSSISERFGVVPLSLFGLPSIKNDPEGNQYQQRVPWTSSSFPKVRHTGGYICSMAMIMTRDTGPVFSLRQPFHRYLAHIDPLPESPLYNLSPIPCTLTILQPWTAQLLPMVHSLI